MKNFIMGWSALAISLVSASALAHDRPRVFQAVEIQSAAPEIAAEGAAWLKRSRDRVDGRVMAKVDKPNTPYSIWWVIFNNPDGCIAACGLADLIADGGVAADVAVFNASGAISAASGESGGIINVDLSVLAGEGAGKGSQDDSFGAPFGQGKFRKKNGLCAEIHVDINEHLFDSTSETPWVDELTYPENPQAFAVFPPVHTGRKCNHHDDSDSD